MSIFIDQTAALQEITGLEALEYQMTRNIETMRHRRADAAFRATFFGTLTIWIGRAFAFYCIFRVFNVCCYYPHLKYTQLILF
jgi:hypothetical protein